MKSSGLAFSPFELYFHLYIQQTEAQKVPFKPDWKSLADDLRMKKESLERTTKILENAGLLQITELGLRVKSCESIRKLKDLVAERSVEKVPELKLETQVVSLPKKKRRTKPMDDDQKHILKSLIAIYNEAWKVRYRRTSAPQITDRQAGMLKTLSRKLSQAFPEEQDKTAIAARYIWSYFLKRGNFFSGHPISKLCMDDIFQELVSNMPTTLRELKMRLPKGSSAVDVDFFASRMRIHK